MKGTFKYKGSILITSFLVSSFLFVISFTLISCFRFKKENSELIKIKIRVIDYYTKLPRKNDSVFIISIIPKFPIRNCVRTDAGVTDSSGEVLFNIKKKSAYRFEAQGLNDTCGINEFEEGRLKNNEMIIIETAQCGGIKRLLDSLH